MSRPSRRHPNKDSWTTVSTFILSVGYHYVPHHRPTNTVLVIHAEETDEEPCKMYEPLARSQYQYYHARGMDSGNVCILDCTQLTKDIRTEVATVGLGPVSKPVSRVVEKLNTVDCILVATSPTAGLIAAKLLRDSFFAERVTGCILYNPYFSAGFARTHLRNSIVTDKPTVAVTLAVEDQPIEKIAAAVNVAMVSHGSVAENKGTRLNVEWESAFPNLHILSGDNAILTKGLGKMYALIDEEEEEEKEKVGESEEEEEEVLCYSYELFFYLDAATKQVEKTFKLLSE